MRFLSVVVACTVVALCGMVAAGAEAAPEIGRCVTVAKSGRLYMGHYLDKSCNTQASPQEINNGGSANRYEWEAGPGGDGGTYTTKGKGGQIKTSRFPVNCKKTLGQGAILSTGTVDAKLTFTGCELGTHTKEECHSNGAGAGEIDTGNLLGTVVEKPGKEIFVEYEPPRGEGPWAQFECAPHDRPKVEVEGEVTAQWAGIADVSVKKSLIEAGATVGEQFLIAEYLTLSREEEEEEAVITFTQTVKFGERYEIRTGEA